METIRPFKEDDCPAIEQIVREIWSMGIDAALEEQYGLIGGKEWKDWVSKTITDFLRATPSQAYVIEADGETAGFGSYRLNSEKRIGEIQYNGVNPRFRGRGLGKKLLEHGLTKLKENGIRLAVVSTGLNEGHAPARNMYEKAGFKPVSRNITYAMNLENS